MLHNVQSCKPSFHPGALRGALRGAKRCDRLQYALLIRDAAVRLIGVHGRWKQFERPKIRLLEAEIGSLRFFYRTPFSGKLPEPSADLKYLAALRGKPVGSLPYGLDIWCGAAGKVLNLEWEFNGELCLASFRRGDWEAEIFRLADGLQAAA